MGRGISRSLARLLLRLEYGMAAEDVKDRGSGRRGKDGRGGGREGRKVKGREMKEEQEGEEDLLLLLTCFRLRGSGGVGWRGEMVRTIHVLVCDD